MWPLIIYALFPALKKLVKTPTQRQGIIINRDKKNKNMLQPHSLKNIFWSMIIEFLKYD